MFMSSISRIFSRRKSQKFSQLPTSPLEEEEDKTFEEHESRTGSLFWSTVPLLCAAIGTALMAGSAGYFVGRQDGHEIYHNGLLATAGTIPSFMIWNNSFSYMTPEESSKAWMSLYPGGLGLVTHPTLAPDVSALAVYHQLHCLQMIHTGYKAAVNKNANLSDPKHPKLINVHQEHCFDYLRQAIICAADTTLEHADPELYGFDTALPKKCRNIGKVAEWAEKWKTNKLPRDMKNRFQLVRSLEKVVYQGADHIEI